MPCVCRGGVHAVWCVFVCICVDVCARRVCVLCACCVCVRICVGLCACTLCRTV